MFEGGTGIGASEFVDWPEDAVPEELPGPDATAGDRRELPETVLDAAAAEAGSAQTTAHARRVSERLTTRA